MTPRTNNNNNRLPHQKIILTLLLLTTTLPTTTYAQCPNNCDPCIGRTVNYIQCPTTNCAQFVQCVDGYTSQTFSCATGLMFDSSTSSCGWIDVNGVTCSADPVCNDPPDASDTGCADIGGSECATPCAEQSDGLYQVAGTNRKKYVLCSYGAVASGFPKTCDGDMLFDSTLKVCNFPDQVTCGDDPVCNPEPDITNTGCEDIGGSECATPCAGKSVGIYQLPGSNRKKYVICSYGSSATVEVSQTVECDEGLLFDSSLKVCNFLATVNCGPDPPCDQPTTVNATLRGVTMFSSIPENTANDETNSSCPRMFGSVLKLASVGITLLYAFLFNR